MQIPADYIPGYEKASAVNPELAKAYVEHTFLGDPEADAVIEELSSYSREEAGRFLNIALSGEGELRAVPPVLRSFTELMATPPDWFDPEASLPGCRFFYRHSYAFMATLCTATLIEGFTTGIAKSFMYTGRLLEGNQAVRRLKQNNRHQMEIFLPGGLAPYCAGWALSLRIRLVHAQVRRLLNNEDGWESDTWGSPIHAAHLALAKSVFSARMLVHAERLIGRRIDDEERTSFMHIWHYVGYLMGFPQALAYESEEENLELFRIGLMCEPIPDMESVVMANTLINAAPVVLGLDAGQAKKLVSRMYRISRALVGDELANQLNFPRLHHRGIIPLFVLEQKMRKLLRKFFMPGLTEAWNFEFMMNVSEYEKSGISYILPDDASAELSRKW